jgi:3-dehydroquinate synthase
MIQTKPSASRPVSPASVKTVRVGLDARAYDVMIGPGLLDRAGQLLSPYLPRGRTVVVTDETVALHHGERLTSALEAGGVATDLIAIPPGEGSKSFAGLEALCDRLLALKLDRGDVITAFGGGVVGDLAGFAASIYKRGIDFIQIPTTLLAQVDSSVGGKTAIDTPRGKNLIGAFHQPRAVLADLDVLATLPPREVRAGYAEVIKYGLLGDAAFFARLEADGADVLALKVGALSHAVARSVEMKAEIVAEDERETGRRALLNLGHTFAHALESETGYGDALLHGEAVGIGCALAFRFSAALGLCSPEAARRCEIAIAAAGLPVRLDELAGAPFGVEALIGHMRQDKKAQAGGLTFVLARAIGEAFIARDVDAAALRAFLISEGAV